MYWALMGLTKSTCSLFVVRCLLEGLSREEAKEAVRREYCSDQEALLRESSSPCSIHFRVRHSSVPCCLIPRMLNAEVSE